MQIYNFFYKKIEYIQHWLNQLKNKKYKQWLKLKVVQQQDRTKLRLEKEKKERLVNQKINMIEKPLNMLDKVDK